ncbi:MAG TPA: hypothetical protein VF889_03575 [Bacteroidota bacterium]
MEAMTQETVQDQSIVTRWIARFIAVSLVLITIIFVTGSGIDIAGADLSHKAQMGAFAVMFLGLLVAWKWEGLGGTLTLGGLALFLVLDYLLFGSFLKFWIFLVFAIPGALFLYCRYQVKHPS